MSTDAYNDILKRVQHELTVEERIRLREELSDNDVPSNGVHETRSLLDALEARGLVGFMQDGPGDLSTNPKHLEGFGKHGQ